MAVDQIEAPDGSVGASNGETESSVDQTRRIAATIGDIVTALSRDPAYQDMPLKDLHARVFPAAVLGQCAIAYSANDQHGIRTPVAVLIWAMVSEKVHHELVSNLAALAALDPKDWRSGVRPFMTARAGASEALLMIQQSLSERLNVALHIPQATSFGNF